MVCLFTVSFASGLCLIKLGLITFVHTNQYNSMLLQQHHIILTY
jgi:hypothetical protein